MKDRRAAARYAEALLSVAEERQAVDSVRQELDDLVGLVEATPGLKQLIARPDLPAERRSQALSTALGGDFSELTLSALRVLLRHDRGDHLPEVEEIYDRLADDMQGVVRAEVCSVIALTPRERSRLLAVLRQMTGRRVALEERVDPTVLAGVRVQIGDRLIDGSAAGRLSRLRKQLLSERG